MLDAVILSDTHLGSGICQDKSLELFLTNLPETKRIILNGDVLDNTEVRLKKKHWRILSLLRKKSDELELVWVAGNHDWNAGSVAHLIGANFVTQYEFQSGGKSILCIHGDIFDDFVSKRPILTWIGDFIYLNLQRFSPVIARLAKRNSKTFMRCCEKVKEDALEFSKADIVICGHTHHAEATESYFNSGCWTENICNYLTVDNGLTELHKWEGENHGTP